MSQSATKSTAPAVGPMVHLEFIQNQALLPEEQGIEAIEAYHRAVFLHHHAADLERFQQQGKIHAERLAHLDSRLKEIQAKLAQRDKLVPVNADGQPDVNPTAPWNFWDRA